MTPRLRLLCLGCAVLTLLAACSKAKPDDAGDDAKATATIKTAVAQMADVPDTLTAFGDAEVAASGEHTLSAPVEAVVTAVHVSPGQQVRAGQVLVEIKPSPGTQAELTKAAGDLDVASKALARALRLRATGLDSDADVEQARAANTAAVQAQSSLAARAGAGLTLRAKAAGVVDSLAATPGDLVAAGAAVAKVGDLGAIRVKLGIEAADIGRLHVGDAVTLKSPGGESVATGSVTEVQPKVDPQTRLAGVMVQAHGGLTIGQSVEGDIVVRTLRLPSIPRAAVIYDQDQAEVFVISGGVAHRKPVTLGPVQGGMVSVRQGLAAGERVATEGAAALEDGMTVAADGAPPPADTDEKTAGKDAAK